MELENHTVRSQALRRLFRGESDTAESDSAEPDTTLDLTPRDLGPRQRPERTENFHEKD
jgi:hypothetical protein